MRATPMRADQPKQDTVRDPLAQTVSVSDLHAVLSGMETDTETDTETGALPESWERAG